MVIPAYNVKRYILSAIESVTNQTMEDIEIIIVDDGSTDGTSETLKLIGDARCRVIRQENRGLSAARNRGIIASQAAYVGFLDGDDVWYANKAASHVAVLDASPRVGVVYSFHAYIDEGGQATGQLLVTRKQNPSLQDLLVRNCVSASVIARKSCLVEAGYFDEELRACEDWEMWVRVRHRTSYDFRLVPEALCGYRVRPDSLTMDYAHHLENAERALAKFEKTVPEFDAGLRQRALAEVYRILARKALSACQLGQARRLAFSALRASPAHCASDIRAAGTFLLIAVESVLPTSLSGLAYRAARRAMRAYYRHWAVKARRTARA